MHRNKAKLELESLESRLTPTASFSLFGSASRIILTQTVATSAGGDLMITDFGDSIEVSDTGADPGTIMFTVTPGASITYNLIGADGAVNLEQAGSRFGNVSLNVSNFAGQEINIGGGEISGNLTIISGNGDDSINLGEDSVFVLGDHIVGGSSRVNTNLGDDSLFMGEGFSEAEVFGNFSGTGINDFDLGDGPGDFSAVNGNLTLNNSREATDSFADISEDSEVGGRFRYSGSRGADAVTVEGFIGDDVFVDFRTQGAADTSSFTLTGFFAELGDRLSVRGGNSGTENVFVDPGTFIGGSINLSLRNGTNNADLSGIMGGRTISYRGGSGEDSFTYSPDIGSARVRITAITRSGDDTVDFGGVVDATTAPSFAYVNMAPGSNTFVDGAVFFPKRVIF